MTIQEWADCIIKGDNPVEVLRVAMAYQRESDAALVEDMNASYRDDNGLSGQRGFSVEAAAAIRGNRR